MIETGRPPAFFVGDHLALDFLNSVAEPWGERIEWLATGEDLVGWLEAGGVIDAKTASIYRSKRFSRARLDRVAAKARELREWLRRFVRRNAGKAVRPDVLPELAPLNRLLARDRVFHQVEGGPRLSVRAERSWRMPDELLGPIAAAIADLLCNVDFELVRFCEGAGCTLAFRDLTKAHARRWCTMAVCGNRAKAAAHRERQTHVGRTRQA